MLAATAVIIDSTGSRGSARHHSDLTTLTVNTADF